MTFPKTSPSVGPTIIGGGGGGDSVASSVLSFAPQAERKRTKISKKLKRGKTLLGLRSASIFNPPITYVVKMWCSSTNYATIILFFPPKGKEKLDNNYLYMCIFGELQPQFRLKIHSPP
jgi:hypothetical protein